MKTMNNFTFSVEVFDDILYIASENSSGAKYEINSLDDVKNYVNYYIDNYVKYMLKEDEDDE